MIKHHNLQYFIGKVCTLFTQPTNRNFKEEDPDTFKEQAYNYFIGVIDAVDEQGILITQISTGLKSYFFMQSLISIAEEEVLDPENEVDSKVIDSLKTINEKMKEIEKTKNDFINVDDLSNKLKNIK